jgi:hypothetical protein
LHRGRKSESPGTNIGGLAGLLVLHLLQTFLVSIVGKQKLVVLFLRKSDRIVIVTFGTPLMPARHVKSVGLSITYSTRDTLRE